MKKKLATHPWKNTNSRKKKIQKLVPKDSVTVQGPIGHGSSQLHLFCLEKKNRLPGNLMRTIHFPRDFALVNTVLIHCISVSALKLKLRSMRLCTVEKNAF